MNAWLAVTDRDRFDFLASQSHVDEVNFWQPNPWGGRFGVLRQGEPLLFKLKSPYNAIAGGGFFERYHDLPLSLAWDAFGSKNGAPSLDVLRKRIVRLRPGRTGLWEDFTIGCIILAEPFFWPEELWIPQPADFSASIVRGKGYDLRTEIGARLWEEVASRLQATAPDRPEQMELVFPGPHTGPALLRRRIGLGTFRVAVTEAYRRQCAVTGEGTLPVLDAAQILPFGEVNTHYVRNGLLLRSDLRRLFHRGYITVTPEYRVEAGGRMREDFPDSGNYLRFHGKSIQVPERRELQPEPEALRLHNEKVFRG